MSVYNVDIQINKLFGSCVEANSKEEAVERAMKEWGEELKPFDSSDLKVDCWHNWRAEEDFYD